jgi:hypothetical protein
MPIKYAEIRIIRKENWFTYFKNWIGDENIITNNDTIIILFEDGTMMDIVENEDENEQFEMGPKSVQYNHPIYFTIKNVLVLFKQPTRIIKGSPNLFSYVELNLDSRPIFKDYPNYTALKKEPSIYNVIYENSTRTEELFALVKRKSNLHLVAYDDSYFEKLDVVNLLHHLFHGL